MRVNQASAVVGNYPPPLAAAHQPEVDLGGFLK